jgi:hypothetical protein
MNYFTRHGSSNGLETAAHFAFAEIVSRGNSP